MRRTTRSIPHLLTLALALGCASAPRVNLASEEQAIRDLDAAQSRAFMAKDLDAVTVSYGPGSYVMPPNAPLVTGREAIRGMFAEMFKLPNMAFSFTPTRIEVSKSGDMAYDIGTYRMSFDGPEGRVDDEGKYATVWKKVDGRWMIASDVTNSDKPLPAPPVAVMMMDVDKMEMQASAGLTWTDLRIPGFAPGAKRTVLHGDPSKEGDYILRLKFPDGYEIPAHWHTQAEHVTVLQGTFMLGMGDRFDRSALRPYIPGDFVYAPAKAVHFAAAKGETVVQLHGTGPFKITVVQ